MREFFKLSYELLRNPTYEWGLVPLAHWSLWPQYNCWYNAEYDLTQCVFAFGPFQSRWQR
jgi:hypothetical protein